MFFFLFLFVFLFFSVACDRRPLTRWICSVSSQKEKVQKMLVSMLVLMQRSLHTVFVWFVFLCAFCVSIGPFQWSEHWISAPPLLQAYIIHTSFSVFTPCVIYCAMTFYYFLCYCIIFLHTYPYKHVHMLFFFVLFFLNCLILSPMASLLFWDESGIYKGVLKLTHVDGRKAWCFHSAFWLDSLALCWPLCTLNCSFFSLLFVVGAPF